MTTCAAYLRVSTSGQKDDLQRAELSAYCLRQGWEMYEYCEVESTRRRRPVLEKLLADVSAKRVNTVLVYKLDRFGRSVRELVSNIEALDRAGCRFIAVTQGIDTDVRNPASRLLLNILASIADFERELILERSAAGTARYRHAMDTGAALASRSGKNKPIGRPRIIVDRQRVKDLIQLGKTVDEMSSILDVKRSTIGRIAQQIRETEARHVKSDEEVA